MRLALLLAACSGEPATTPVDTDLPTVPTLPGTPAEVRAFAIHPDRPLVRVGGTAQLRGLAAHSGGQVTHASADVSWGQADPGLSLTAAGLLTGATPGEAGFSATLDGRTVHARAVVVPADLAVSAVVLRPAHTTLPPGALAAFAAQATLADGTTGDLGSECAWSSSDPLVATVGAAGLLSSVGPGQLTLTATCGEHTATALVTVAPPEQPTPAPALVARSLRIEPVTNDRFVAVLTVDNLGGQVGPLEVAFTTDGAEPRADGDRRGSTVGVGPGAAAEIRAELTWGGERPAPITTWALLDPDAVWPDPDRTDDFVALPHDLPGDALADIEVHFDEAIVFGPTDAAVLITVTNHGPEPVQDLVLWFEEDQPVTTSLADLDPVSAEASETLPELLAHDSYTWLLSLDRIPYPDPWTSCGFARPQGVLDPDLTNNFDCILFQEF